MSPYVLGIKTMKASKRLTDEPLPEGVKLLREGLGRALRAGRHLQQSPRLPSVTHAHIPERRPDVRASRAERAEPAAAAAHSVDAPVANLRRADLLVPPAKHPQRTPQQPEPQRGRLQLLSLHQQLPVLRPGRGGGEQAVVGGVHSLGGIASRREERLGDGADLLAARHRRTSPAPQTASHQLQLERGVRHGEGDVAGEQLGTQRPRRVARRGERGAVVAPRRGRRRAFTREKRIPQSPGHAPVSVPVLRKVEHLEAHVPHVARKGEIVVHVRQRPELALEFRRLRRVSIGVGAQPVPGSLRERRV